MFWQRRPKNKPKLTPRQQRNEAVEKAVREAIAKTEQRMRQRFVETHKALYLSYGTALKERNQLVKALERDLDSEQKDNSRLRAECDTLKINIDQLNAIVEESTKLILQRAATLAAKQEPTEY